MSDYLRDKFTKFPHISTWTTKRCQLEGDYKFSRSDSHDVHMLHNPLTKIYIYLRIVNYGRETLSFYLIYIEKINVFYLEVKIEI